MKESENAAYTWFSDERGPWGLGKSKRQGVTAETRLSEGSQIAEI